MQLLAGLMPFNHDLVIIGGGLVGATLAYALAKHPLNIALLDAKPVPTSPGPFDQRALALTLASQRIYQSLNIWSAIQSNVTPIQTIHVSDAGHFSHTRFNAADYHLDAFGHVIQAGKLQKVLDELIQDQENLSVQRATQVKQLQLVKDGVRLTVETPAGVQEIKTRLVVAADGTFSAVRQLLNIAVQEWDYGQTALVAQVQLQQPHAHVAFERFKGEEVIAALPLQNDKAVMVWTMANYKWAELQSLSSEALLLQIQQAFGQRLGRFTQLLNYEVHKLAGLQAKEQCRQNIVLMGNAVHTLHPIAAQGFNLGLRDVAVFIELLTEQIKQKQDLQSIDWLIEYERKRQPDQDFTIMATNQLLRIFRSSSLSLQLSRHLVISALNFMPSIKKHFAERAMGLVNDSSRLLAGAL